MTEETVSEVGHGAEMSLHVTWVFKLDRRDSLLVLKALGGRLTPEEVPLAHELCDRLTKLRAAEALNFSNPLQRHAENVDKKKHG